MFKYMLDTNIVIYVIKRRPLEIMDIFNANAGIMVISSITLAEMLHGVEKSAAVARNRLAVENFVSRLTVLRYDDKAAMHYGDIRADLERKGTPIGVNDIHIAAHARSEGLIVVTNNMCEFNRINGLMVENWLN
ncbi:tRNA(fMet)-specific endonuclease VapC [Acerihabitans sp. TG2]|uniref:type II toxin-antitoxin system tRNA(fMet)-specific endonuclease VapC n=1 Tax=Acerihabitans sp. TG2 TaxID=3096008 RepID=UPI002B233D0F|nr:tRNA(fMet)-specific endonuclease VapC [Acerihabitans sp. TG2]MEA9392857.1 tRNA(fMet)-specific endonuclease VapC [Acerihabitans sp. TG2]